MAVKATKGASITLRVNALLHRRTRPTDFEIRALKRDIEGVKNANLGEYYMLLGMIHSLAGDVEKSIEFHEKSLRVSGDVVDYTNYGLSMRRLGRGSISLPIMLKALEMSGYSPDVLQDTMSSMLYSGDFSRFDEVISKFSKTHPEAELVPQVASVNAIRGDLKFLEIPESEFQRAMEIVESVVVGCGHVPDAMDVSISSFEGVNHLYGEIVLSVSGSEELSSINDRIADAIISAEDLECWDRLIFNVVPRSDEEGEAHVA